jgi:pimeloyl-ACP methyl ester carboxylesterase
MAVRPRLRTAALTAVAAGAVAAAAILERRHLRGLQQDEDYRRLSAPLGGRTQPVGSADGTTLNAVVFGPEDADTVVLAHGWTERLELWGPVIGELTARGLRVVAYDLRGHGLSGAAAGGDYALDRFGEDLEAVLRATVSEPTRAIVVGHSLGGMAIAAWAQGHDIRGRARAVALVNTGLGDLLAEHLLLGPAGRMNPRVSRAFMSARGPVLPVSTPIQTAAIRYVAFGPGASTGTVAFLEQMVIDTPSEVRAACGAALSDMDLWHALGDIELPALVVAGERDRLTPPSHARRIAAGLPQPAGLIEFPGCGHMSPLERPRELADAIASLVAETAATAAPRTTAAKPSKPAKSTAAAKPAKPTAAAKPAKPTAAAKPAKAPAAAKPAKAPAAAKPAKATAAAKPATKPARPTAAARPAKTTPAAEASGPSRSRSSRAASAATEPEARTSRTRPSNQTAEEPKPRASRKPKATEAAGEPEPGTARERKPAGSSDGGAGRV